MSIAVTGSTGLLGRFVIAQLKDRIPALQVLALARTPAKASALGVAVREADYARPETLIEALYGVDRLLLISSSDVGQRTAQHRNVIEAARSAGVRHVIYTSLLHADVSPMALAVEHRETEALLSESGLAVTVLRNGWYTENYTGSLKAAVAAGALIGSAGQGRIASATRADLAAAAALVLTAAGHEGHVYELAGDEAYTLADLAAEVSRQTGKTIPYVDLPPSDYAAALVKVGLPPGLAQVIAASDVDAARGALLDDGRALSRLLGRPTTSLSQAVAAALK